MNEVNSVENVQVVIRIRPLQQNEKKEGDFSCVQSINNGKEIQVKVGPLDAQVYKCNMCFPPETSQSTFFNQSGITNLIDSAIVGYRTCAFAFGQTGAGKTFTMIGSSRSIHAKDKQSGMVGHSLEYLFNKLNSMNVQYKIKLSCYEIYHENVYDLFAEDKDRISLPVREHSENGFFLEGCKMVECESYEFACGALDIAMKSRQVGLHDLNSRSSRSHCITDIFLEIPAKKSVNGDEKNYDGSLTELFSEENDEPQYIVKGKLSLVDLAGSERLKSTNSTGKVLQEAGFINRSLYVLGKVIAGLVRTNGDLNHKDVPYRDSKLTKLLIGSLWGETKTLLISCVSEAKSSQSETLRTLKFSMSCARIRNKPVKFLDPHVKLVLELKEEIKRLRKENKKLRNGLVSAPAGTTTESQEFNSVDERSTKSKKAGKRRPLSENVTTKRANRVRSSSISSKAANQVGQPQPRRDSHSSQKYQLEQYKQQLRLPPSKKKEMMIQQNKIRNAIEHSQIAISSDMIRNDTNHDDMRESKSSHLIDASDSLTDDLSSTSSKRKKFTAVQLEDALARRGIGPRIFKGNKDIKPLQLIHQPAPNEDSRIRILEERIARMEWTAAHLHENSSTLNHPGPELIPLHKRDQTDGESLRFIPKKQNNSDVKNDGKHSPEKHSMKSEVDSVQSDDRKKAKNKKSKVKNDNNDDTESQTATNKKSNKISPYISHLAPKSTKKVKTSASTPLIDSKVHHQQQAHSPKKSNKKPLVPEDDSWLDDIISDGKKSKSNGVQIENKLPQIKNNIESPPIENKIKKEESIKFPNLFESSPKSVTIMNPDKSPSHKMDTKLASLSSSPHRLLSENEVRSKLRKLETVLNEQRVEMEDNPGDVTHEQEQQFDKLRQEVKRLKNELELALANTGNHSLDNAVPLSDNFQDKTKRKPSTPYQKPSAMMEDQDNEGYEQDFTYENDEFEDNKPHVDPPSEVMATEVPLKKSSSQHHVAVVTAETVVSNNPSIGGVYQVGDKVQGRYGTGFIWYNATIRNINEGDGTYSLSYDDGDSESMVPPNRIRMQSNKAIISRTASKEDVVNQSAKKVETSPYPDFSQMRSSKIKVEKAMNDDPDGLTIHPKIITEPRIAMMNGNNVKLGRKNSESSIIFIKDDDDDDEKYVKDEKKSIKEPVANENQFEEYNDEFENADKQTVPIDTLDQQQPKDPTLITTHDHQTPHHDDYEDEFEELNEVPNVPESSAMMKSEENHDKNTEEDYDLAFDEED